jgi:hypothetical protein
LPWGTAIHFSSSIVNSDFEFANALAGRILRSCRACDFSAAAPVSGASEIRSGSPTPAAVSSNAPVDRLIPLLLNEDRQLRGIPFSDVIFAATGKRVLAFDPQTKWTNV